MQRAERKNGIVYTIYGVDAYGKARNLWDGRYQAQKIENWITETAFCYRFPIYTVTRLQIEYYELIKAIYNYMKKRFLQ